MAERIKLSDFEEKVLNSSVPVLVDFIQTVVFLAKGLHQLLEQWKMRGQKAFRYTRLILTLMQMQLLNMK